MLKHGSPEPVLVAKLPRLPAGNPQISHEIRNLRLAQASRAGGFDSIPRIVATDEVGGGLLLVETALHGSRLTPESLRADFEGCAQPVFNWLIEFHLATADASRPDYATLLEAPLQHFLPMLVRSPEDETLLERVYAATAPLRSTRLPSVFEHGDLFYPNILLQDGQVSVLDWETGTPSAFPGGDLFLFLGLSAFSLAGRFEDLAALKPFEGAFFPAPAWTRRYIEDYMRALGIGMELWVPLFVAFWTRYLVLKSWRTCGALLASSHSPDYDEAVASHAAQLRRTREYRLWRYMLQNLEKLR
jgi:hypothetical protein